MGHDKERSEIRVCTDRILEADIERLERVATRARSPEEAARLRMAILSGKKWENGRVLKVSFIDGVAEVQEKVAPIAREWSNFANLTLDFGDHTDADIRISFAQAGSWSYLGTDARGIPSGQPTMNYGWLDPDTGEREYRRVVLHEFGHALGAIHEHQNPSASIPWDKEAVYKYFAGPPNNWTKDKVDNNLFRTYSADITQFTKFDPHSIMLYAIPNEFTVGDFEVGWNTELSDKDMGFVSQLYPKGAEQAVKLMVGGPPKTGTTGSHGSIDLYSFEVSEPGSYRIETHGDQDMVLTLAGPGTVERVVAEDDDSGVGDNAMLSVELEPGEYFAMVRHYWPQVEGQYEVGVDQA